MEWKDQLTKKEQDNRLKRLKAMFRKLESDDWEHCSVCKFFGMPKCELTCGAVMKHLHRRGEVSTDTSTTPLRDAVYGVEDHASLEFEPAADMSDFGNGEE